MKEIAKQFDDSALTDDVRDVVKNAEADIREFMSVGSEKMMQIADRLMIVRESLDRGHFCSWLQTKFDWSESFAFKTISAANFCKTVDSTVSKLPARTLYLLAAPSTPGPIRKAVVADIQAGRPVKYADVRDRVRAAKPARKPRTPSLPTQIVTATPIRDPEFYPDDRPDRWHENHFRDESDPMFWDTHLANGNPCPPRRAGDKIYTPSAQRLLPAPSTFPDTPPVKTPPNGARVGLMFSGLFEEIADAIALENCKNWNGDNTKRNVEIELLALLDLLRRN